MANNDFLQRPVEPGHRYTPRHSGTRPGRHLAMDGFRSVSRQPIQATHKTVSLVPETNNTTHVAPPHDLKPEHAKQISGLYSDSRHPRADHHKQNSQSKPALPRQHKSVVLKRQFVQRAEHAKRQQQKQRHGQTMAFLFGCMTVMGLIGGVIVILPSKAQSPQASESAVLAKNIDVRNSFANETAPSIHEINTHEVASEAPRLLHIPKLGAKARVMSVNEGFTGLPMLPHNIHDAGWLNSSARPGMGGVILFDGRADSGGKKGVFAEVNQLVIGDALAIDRGDGKRFVYRIVEIEDYSGEQFNMQLASQSPAPGKSTLNVLVTTGDDTLTDSPTEKYTLISAIE